MDKITPLGERLLASFAEEISISDKKVIAEKLGFKSEQSVYKVINGNRELSFDALQKFQTYTKRSIDWLLTGEGEKYLKPNVEVNFDDLLDQRIRTIVREELAKSEAYNSVDVHVNKKEKEKKEITLSSQKK